MIPFPIVDSTCPSFQFTGLLLSDAVIGYLRSCSQATPTMSHSRAWLLRHEHHFLYLLLRLSHRLVGVDFTQTPMTDIL